MNKYESIIIVNPNVDEVGIKALEDKLTGLINENGKVESVALIKDNGTGRFRGFCFINMDDEYSKMAIEKLNKTKFAGRIIDVMPANMKKRRKKKSKE